MQASPDLVQALGGGMPLTVVGNGRLSGRLGRVLVLARSDGRSAHLAASFFGPAQQPGASDDRFTYTRGPLGQLILSAGSWPGLVPLLSRHAGPLPVAGLEAGIARFCELVDLTAGSPVPIMLSPEGHRVDTAVEGITRFVSSLRSGPAPGSRPGHVYEPPPGDAATVRLADIGGLDEAKSELETICLAIRDPRAFSDWGARPPRGLLLYGEPGTGKTMLARALATESGARFIHVRATDVVSKWYGEAERNLQSSFDWARRERPSVLFFDEIDAIAPHREGSHEATHRLVTTFLENLDGLRTAEGVIVVAATNRPEQVDRALTRAGRFDRLVEVPMPDAAARRAIFAIHIGRASREAGRELFAVMDEAAWESLMEASQGFSGADIAEVVRRALEAKVRKGARGGIVTVEQLFAEVAPARRPF